MKENVYMYLRVATKEQVSGCIKCDSHNSKEKRKIKNDNKKPTDLCRFFGFIQL